MIIGIDTRIALKKKTGIGYLISNLIPMLVEIDDEINFKLLGDSLGISQKNVKAIHLRGIVKRGFNFWWKTFGFPPANILTGRSDKFLFTNFVDFPVKTKERTLLVPDLSFVKYPEFVEKKNLKFLNNVARSIKRADKIITISESTKKEIVDYYNIKSEKVNVVYLAASQGIMRISDQKRIQATRNKYGIKNKYILFVGTTEPRKNIGNLIRAYNELGDSLKKQYMLVIAGGRSRYGDDPLDLVKRLNLSKRIIFTGYLDEAGLSCVYSGASAFVFPSLYEGFGIPVLESFKCEIPVAASFSSSIPEVGGDAALYFDPQNIDDMKEKIQCVLRDEKLRHEMIEKGHEQLKRFSWEKAAERTLEVLLK